MNVAGAKHVRKFFKVLQTSKRSQTAVMNLKPRQSSGPKGTDHPKSEQVLLVLSGAVFAEIGTKTRTLKAGGVVVVPAGVKHRFSNKTKRRAVTFNVYAPPAYDPHEESDAPDDE